MKVINYLVFTVAIFCVLNFLLIAQTNAAVHGMIQDPNINSPQHQNSNCRPTVNQTSHQLPMDDGIYWWN